MPNEITQKNIPQGWQVKKLGEVSVITNGSTNTQDAVIDGKFPLFDRSVEIKRSNKYLYDSDAVILPGEGAEFVPKYYSGKFDLHQRAYAIFPGAEIDALFLYQYLYANKKEFLKKSVGSTVRSLRLPLVQSVLINVPPLNEQQKIAEILGAVDEDIAKTQEVIEKTEKLKKGLMQQLFTRGIGHTKFKKTKLGMIPDEWGIINFGKVATIINGQVDPKQEPYRNMILVAPNHIESGSGRIIERESAEVQGAISGKYLVDKGDIIYSKIRPYLQKVALAVEQCLCSADMYPIKGTDKLDNVFLFYILLGKNFTDFANSNSARTGIPKINREELYSYEFALPSINEQQKIAEILSAVDAKISINKKLKAKLIRLKKGLMQDLLSGKTRVVW